MKLLVDDWQEQLAALKKQASNWVWFDRLSRRLKMYLPP
jgi:hypothetical protein